MSGIDDYTKLLLHLDNDYTDSSSSRHTISTAGDPTFSTTKVFGSHSVYFDGTGDYLTVPNSPDWSFGSDDFTIDFRLNFTTKPAGDYPQLVTKWDGGSANKKAWSIYYNINTNALVFEHSTNGSTGVVLQVGWVAALSNWYHIAVVRDSSDLVFYINGTRQGDTQTIGINSIYNSDTDVHIGTAFVNGSSSATSEFNGYIDELRISKGIARWTSNFTPPTEAYSGDNGIYISGTKNDTSRIFVVKESNWSIEHNAVVSGSGDYTITNLTPGQKTILALDDSGEVDAYGDVKPIYANMPADEDLVAHWKLDEKSGTTAYDSAGSIDGTVMGTGSSWVNDHIGTGYKTGNSTPINLNSTFQSTFRSPFTMSGWVSTRALANITYHIVGSGDDSSSVSDNRFIIYTTSDGSIRVSYSANNNHSQWISGTDNRPWDIMQSPLMHITTTVDTDYIRVYVNGEIIDHNGSSTGVMSGVTMSTYTGFYNLCLGARLYFSGTDIYRPVAPDSVFADWRIYNYALNADEVYALWASSGIRYDRDTTMVVEDDEDAAFRRATQQGWTTGQPQTLYLGNDYDLTFLFKNVQIPQGAIITNAAMSGRSNWDEYTDYVYLEIDVADTANASAPANYEEFDDIDFTGDVVHWDIEGYVRWNSGGEVLTPDITSLIQSIVNKSSWQSGNNILITIYDDLTSTSARAFRSYAGGGETAWTEYLRVNWKQNL